MKTIIAMLLISVSAQAQIVDNRTSLAPTAQDVLETACEHRVQMIEYAPNCAAISQRARQGYPVSRRDFENWCSAVGQLDKEMKADQAKYKKMTHKKLDYKKCPESAG